MAEAVAELNPFDDLGEAVSTVEFASFSLRRHHQLESHCQPGLPAQTPFGPRCAVPDRGEGAFDRVRRPDVLEANHVLKTGSRPAFFSSLPTLLYRWPTVP